ncbi:MAG TPA: hypothetical protein VGQ14_01975 [Candidatus Eisenbacteria bacterium]|nr:hypothetical protein [Candidatus Eisenbacteria bacterium]
MKRSTLAAWTRTLVLVALMAFAASGCGETPVTGPLTSGTSGSNAPSSSAPRLVLEPTGGTATFETAPDMNADGTPVLDASSALRALTSSAEIDGAVGGALRCGRFVLKVPPGAFEGKGTVTMNVPDSEIAFVDLSISGVPNQFKTGVALSYDPTGLNLTDPITIYWYDTATQDWVDLHARTNLLPTGYPTVLLSHFSPYGGGKAGW